MLSLSSPNLQLRTKQKIFSKLFRVIMMEMPLSVIKRHHVMLLTGLKKLFKVLSSAGEKMIEWLEYTKKNKNG